MYSLAERLRQQQANDCSLQMLINKKQLAFNLDPATHKPQSFMQETNLFTEQFITIANNLVAEFIRPFCKEKTLLKAAATVIP